jgi:hypothetical protein
MARSWPSLQLVPSESLPRGRSSPASCVHLPGSSTVCGWPAVTDGLDGELARLQDQGTGGMAPLATPRQRWTCGAVPVLAVTSGPTRAGRRRGPAGPKSGRPGDRERARVRRVPSQLRIVVAPRSGQCSHAWRFCMSGGQSMRRAPRALEDVLKVLTGRCPTRCPTRCDADCVRFAYAVPVSLLVCVPVCAPTLTDGWPTSARTPARQARHHVLSCLMLLIGSEP